MPNDATIPLIYVDNRTALDALPSDPDRLVLSRLVDVRQSVERSGLSVKYVFRGTECYAFDGIARHVDAGSFLIVNEGRSYEVIISADAPAIGLCLYFSPGRLQDVHHALTHGDAALLDRPTAADDAPAFYEHLLRDHETPLGRRLRRLAERLLRGEDALLDIEEVHTGLAAALLRTQGQVRRAMDRLPAARASTRAELYRRLRLARDLMETHYAQPLTVADVAREAALSEYHLIRSFKHVFGTTPYRYLLDRRLETAAALLGTHDRSVTEVAHEVGFSDLAAFSKAFKKYHGVSPSRIRA